MVRKINNEYSQNSNLEKSDIYRKYTMQFQYLLNKWQIVKSNEEFEDIYVEDTEFESQIESFRKTVTDMVRFCVGPYGIGKTTAVRHCFELGNSNDACVSTSRGELVLFVLADMGEDGTRFDLTKTITAACTKLEKEFPDLKNHMRKNAGKIEFYKFMSSHTRFALENGNPVNWMDMDRNELMCAKLKGAYENNLYECEANRLKFYIKKNYQKYKRLIIILDGIERLKEETQIEIIGNLLKFKKCMQNTDYPTDGDYHVNLMILACPSIYKMCTQRRNVEAHAINEPAIMKKKPVDLSLIFKKRFDYYSKIIQSDATPENPCYCELMKLNERFDEKYKEIIIQLCFWNVRNALAAYAGVLANRCWIQKDKPKEENFSIVSSEYQFNDISVIRALACNENKLYFGDNCTIIPNIFYTTEEEDYSIYCLLVLRYFYKKKGSNEYGMNTECVKDINEKWKAIFGEDISQKFNRALKFLFDNKILIKLIEDYNDERLMKVILEDENKLHISACGNILYEMFGMNSVLLEMLRENAWRDDTDKDNYSDLPSRELMDLSKQGVIFKDLLEYINYLREQEEDIVSVARNLTKSDAYKAAFGEKSMADILLSGVKKSLIQSQCMNEPGMNAYYTNIENRVRETEKKIRD